MRSFGKWRSKSEVEDNGYKLRVAWKNKEVLVAFRGDIPETLFELINHDTGKATGPLASIFEQVAVAERGHRFFDTCHSTALFCMYLLCAICFTYI